MLNLLLNFMGVVYDVDDIVVLVKVLVVYFDVWIMSDDIYEYIVYDGFCFVMFL